MLRCALHGTSAGHFEKVGLRIPALLQFLRFPRAVCHSEALADESGGVARSFFNQMLRCALHDTLVGHFEKVQLKIPALLQLLRLPGAVCHSEALADESEGVAQCYFSDASLRSA